MKQPGVVRTEEYSRSPPFSAVCFGSTRTTTGAIETDKKFTGQRLDGTGLYYYGARYYDPTIGRFISADTIVPDPMNAQALNRYSYVLNNPLKYVDPSGHIGGTVEIDGDEYTVVEDGGGNHHLVGSDGSQSASLSLADLIEMIAGYMRQMGDYGYGGGYDIGSVVTVNVQSNLIGAPIPVHYVPEGWTTRYRGTLPGFIMDSSGGGGVTLDFGGGAFVRYQSYQQAGAASLLESVTLHETKHYAEQWTWGKWWYGEYIGEFGVRLASERRFWAAHDAHSAEIRAVRYADRMTNGQPSFWDGPGGGYVNSAIRALRIAVGQ